MNPSDRAPSALSEGRFRVFLAGVLVARTGDWLDLVALNWAVLQLTDSPWHLGLINACRMLPVFLVSVPAGVLADRCDRRRLLIAVQAGVCLLTLLVGFLIARAAPFRLFAAVVALRALLSAMDPPVRQALIPGLVKPQALAGAVALQAAALNLARIVGPALSGFLLAAWSVGWVFVLAAAAQALSWLSLAVTPTGDRPARVPAPVTADLAEAAGFVRRHPVVPALLVLAIVPMIFGFPYTAMMPLFAQDLLGLGAQGYGWLLTATAVGALSASGRLAVRSAGGRSAGKWLLGSILAFGVSLLLLVAATGFWSALVPAILVGATGQTYRTLSRVTLQEQVPDHLRGRVLSLALMDRGFIPLGSLLVAAVAAACGAFWGGVLMGGGCILATLLVMVLKPGMRDL